MVNIDNASASLTETTVEGQVTSPLALWNPTVAGRWSLIFSPVFGAYLHMKNWQVLGDPIRAAKSRNWVIGSFLLLLIRFLLPLVLPDTKAIDMSFRSCAFALLVSWYYSLGKFQQSYVAARFGTNYERRDWTVPLLVAVGAIIFLYLLNSWLLILLTR